MTHPDNSTILKLAIEQSTFDSNCKPEDFLRSENIFTESVENPNAHRYLKLPLVLDSAFCKIKRSYSRYDQINIY